MFSCMVDHQKKEQEKRKKNLLQLSILLVLVFVHVIIMQNYYHSLNIRTFLFSLNSS